MEFREATDRLLAAGYTLEEIADAMDASKAAVAQARMSPEAGGYRSPPPAWRRGALHLARRRAEDLRELAEALEKES